MLSVGQQSSWLERKLDFWSINTTSPYPPVERAAISPCSVGPHIKVKTNCEIEAQASGTGESRGNKPSLILQQLTDHEGEVVMSCGLKTEKVPSWHLKGVGILHKSETARKKWSYKLLFLSMMLQTDRTIPMRHMRHVHVSRWLVTGSVL